VFSKGTGWFRRGLFRDGAPELPAFFSQFLQGSDLVSRVQFEGIMEDRQIPKWLAWAREIQALSQTGLHFSQDQFNTQRYTRLMEIAAEMVVRQTQLGKTEIIEDFSLQTGYTTPKVDVRGAVLQNGQILMVQERTDRKWCMPGGWADVGETPSEMVKREVLEESGFIVRPLRVVGIYDANRGVKPLSFYHAYKIVFHCELVGGEAQPSEETLAVKFFSFDNLPELSTMRTNEKHISDVAKSLADSNWGAYFD
jgi:ADP-ribose pyrophosphatase YjhB (NUDIX family)